MTKLVFAHYFDFFSRRVRRVRIWRAILFNPIAPISLESETWDLVDFVVLVYLVAFQLKWQKMDCHGDKSSRNDEK